MSVGPPDAEDLDVDEERRFGGLRRLYGEAAYRRLRGLTVAVVGVGGVGSWTAEALARSGVAGLVLLDLDHVAESNVNRQVQALGRTLGQAKVQALRERIADIHPGCRVHAVEAFVTPEEWPAQLPCPVDALVDACDQVSAKLALAAWSRATGVPTVCVGAAGGKRAPQRVEVGDLAEVTHDPLLASLRQRLRRAHGAPRQGRIGLACVYSREAVQRPEAACEPAGGPAGKPARGADAGAAGAPAPAAAVDGSLNCAGYGSSVMVTATFGLTAAAAAVEAALARTL